MNVKTVANPITSLDQVSKSQGKERVKTFESADRDANGKQEQAPHEESREFTEEEIEELLQKLRSLPAVQSAGLIIQTHGTDQTLKFHIKSPQGEIVKVLTPMQAWESTQMVDQDRPKGQLLNKAM